MSDLVFVKLPTNLNQVFEWVREHSSRPPRMTTVIARNGVVSNVSGRGAFTISRVGTGKKILGVPTFLSITGGVCPNRYSRSERIILATIPTGMSAENQSPGVLCDFGQAIHLGLFFYNLMNFT